jgi:hypothetical protein
MTDSPGDLQLQTADEAAHRPLHHRRRRRLGGQAGPAGQHLDLERLRRGKIELKLLRHGGGDRISRQRKRTGKEPPARTHHNQIRGARPAVHHHDRPVNARIVKSKCPIQGEA